MRLDSQQYCDAAWESVREYIDGVNNGNIVANKWIKLAVARYIRMIQNKEKFVYRVDRVDKVFKFFSYLNIEHQNQYKQMDLMPWQAFTLAFIFGFYEKENIEKRVIRECMIFMGRKNGKTALSSAIILYGMLADGVQNPTSLLLANTTQQASVCLNFAKDIVNHSPDLFKRLSIHRNKIIFSDNKKQGFAQIFSTVESTRLEGYSPSLTICDEVHAWPNANVYNAIISGIGARINPLTLVITTAGSNNNGFCREYLMRHQNILEDKIQDDHLLGMLYMPDTTDDLADPECWVKANPSLGVINSLKDLITQFDQAKYSYADKYAFITKNLNIFYDTPNVWIPNEDLVPVFDKDLKLEDFEGRDCYVGMDLSSNTDLTAIVLLFPPTDTDEKFYVYPIFFMANREHNFIRKNGKDLTYWIRQGHIIKCDSKVIDLNQIYEKIMDLSTHFNIISITYDKYNTPQLVARLQEANITCDNFEQNARKFNAPLKLIETYIYENKIRFFNNSTMLWMFSNVVLFIDSNNNIKVMKNRQNDSVDGIVALGMAVGGFIESKYGIELIGLNQYIQSIK